MRARIVHYNPRSSKNISACSLPLAKLVWTIHKEATECRNCLRSKAFLEDDSH